MYDSRPFITVVSGLPRSGTSMMMKMLEAGGIPPLTDHLRAADEDNPRGYYEFERVKALESDSSWMPQAQGRAVKVISALLRHLPTGFRYKVLFMERDMKEVLASQRRMLERRGAPADPSDDERMAKLFERHLADVRARLTTGDVFDVLEVRYDAVLADPPAEVARIRGFLGVELDEARMAAEVDRELYRQQRPA